MPVRLTGMISGLDTESLIKGMVDAQKLKNKRTEDKSTLLSWKQDKWKELNAKLYKLYTDDLSKMRMQGNYQTKKVTSSNENLFTVTGVASATNGTHTLEITQLASAQYLTGDKIFGKDTEGKDIDIKSSTKLTDLKIAVGSKITFNNETLTIDEDTTIAKVVEAAKKAGLNASFDVNQGRFFISSKESGTANSFSVSGDAAVLDILGLSSTKATTEAAKDSIIKYNGATLTNSSNVVKVNGLTFTLKGVTNGETLSANVTNDTQAAYDMVKKFISSYNDILKEMNNLYYADSARGYAPLSSDEKQAMTDDQIEKWESKIKDSLLRRDNTLGSLLDVMKTSLQTSVTVDGKKYSLASYGIQTSKDYLENGLLHINGNADDPLYSSIDDKLMKALEEDPDTVMEVLSGISKNLYDEMNDKMKAIPNVRSALTFYNDKEMAKQQTEYAKKIALLESKLTEMENKYYKQFAAMEKAMAQMQSQSNALAGMFGSNNNK